MRVLITGAAGSLGRQLAPELKEHGHDLVCFDLQRAEGVPGRWVRGDVRIPHQVLEAAQGCEALIHTPAWHGIHLGGHTRREFWELNVDGAFNAFQAASTLGMKKILFCSTMGVYGGAPRPEDRAFRITDDTPAKPAKDIYAYTKAMGEQLLELYHRAYGLDVAIFRLGMFVPCDFFHYGMRLLHGGVDERDLARAFRRALEKDDLGFGTYNLFSPVPFTEADDAALLTDPLPFVQNYYEDAGVLDTAARGRTLHPAWYEVKGDAIVPSPVRTYYTSDRAREELGWEPRFDFARFLKDLKEGEAEYVRENRYPVPNAPG